MNFRPSPEMEQRIRATARRDHRSIGRQIEWLLDYALTMLEHTTPVHTFTDAENDDAYQTVPNQKEEYNA